MCIPTIHHTQNSKQNTYFFTCLNLVLVGVGGEGGILIKKTHKGDFLLITSLII